jgi:hypothetical protein
MNAYHKYRVLLVVESSNAGGRQGRGVRCSHSVILLTQHTVGEANSDDWTSSNRDSRVCTEALWFEAAHIPDGGFFP